MRLAPHLQASSAISLFRSGLGLRFGLAAALVVPLWLAIAWTLGA